MRVLADLPYVVFASWILPPTPEFVLQVAAFAPEPGKHITDFNISNFIVF